MMKTLSRIRRRVRGERGQAALEALIVFPIWIIVLTLFVNLLLFLGSAMLMQANVDRAAFQASALGCVTVGAGGVQTQLLGRSGFGVHNVTVAARYLAAPGAPAVGTDNGYYTVTKTDFVDSSGNILPATGRLEDATAINANTTDCVPDGDWIFIQVTYQQNLWLFGQRTVRSDALVISHSLQGAS